MSNKTFQQHTSTNFPWTTIVKSSGYLRKSCIFTLIILLIPNIMTQEEKINIINSAIIAFFKNNEDKNTVKPNDILLYTKPSLETGLKIRNTLRYLDDSGMLSKIPSVHVDRSGSNRKWTFIRSGASNIKNNKPLPQKATISTQDKNYEELMNTSKFFPIYNLRTKGHILNYSGFYAIILKKSSKLPAKYNAHLGNGRILYIGKAEVLGKRLGQELEAKGHGTFFRSIGVVLGYRPQRGSLIGYENKNNYKFSMTDTAEIIAWLRENCLIHCINYSDLTKEKSLISKYKPLLNDTHNPNKLEQLKLDRAECRIIASSL